jgi:hypothetical protein
MRVRVDLLGNSLELSNNSTLTLIVYVLAGIDLFSVWNIAHQFDHLNGNRLSFPALRIVLAIQTNRVSVELLGNCSRSPDKWGQSGQVRQLLRVKMNQGQRRIAGNCGQLLNNSTLRYPGFRGHP